MFNNEGLVVLTGKEEFASTDNEILAIINEEGNGESFELNGLQCVIKRVHSGIWCGYVGVDRNHPWYGMNYQDVVTIKDLESVMLSRNPSNVSILSLLIDMMDNNLENDQCSISTAIDVHGGITFSGKFDDDDLWYFGFDCGHCNDFVPAFSYMTEGAIYRDKEFVKNECHRLVDQLLTVPYDAGKS